MSENCKLALELAVILLIVAVTAPKLLAYTCTEVYPYGCPTNV